MVRRVVMLLSVAAIVAAMTLVSSAIPAMGQPDQSQNQSSGPSCGHDFCNWYQECTWQFWAWDSGVGWTLIDTDGSC